MNEKREKVVIKLLFLFVSVSSCSFFAFVRSHFMSFSFFSAWHVVIN